MTATLELTPDAAARIYERPRYGQRRTRLTVHQARQALNGLASQFKHSSNPWIMRFGQRIERWLNPQRV